MTSEARGKLVAMGMLSTAIGLTLIGGWSVGRWAFGVIGLLTGAILLWMAQEDRP